MGTTQNSKTPVTEAFMEQARALHRRYPVVDAHFDLAAEVYERRLAGERNIVENRYLSHFQEAGLKVLVSSVYVTDRYLPEQGLRRALGQIAALREDLESVRKEIGIVTSRAELEEALAAGRIAVLLALEGLDPLGNDLLLLRTFYDLGVRGASLTWSRRNAFATGCCKAGEYREISGELTESGKKAVSMIEELGLYLDVSHLNNEGFAGVCACAKKPFVASHSNAWSVSANYRNLRDDQIEAIAGRGGLIGLNACALLTGEKSLSQLARHAEYLVSRAGAAHVGFGLDLCRGLDETTPRIRFETEDDDILSHHGEIIRLTALLLERGMRTETVIGLMGGNFLRFFRSCLR